MTPVLEIQHIRKSYGAAPVLRGISFQQPSGEVLALLGQNGAGKSTLIKILTGVLAADAGTVSIAGRLLQPSVAAARAAGVAVIYQDLSLFPNLSVAENIAARDAAGGGLGFDPAIARRGAQAVLDRMETTLPLDQPVGELSVAKQQLVAIARALTSAARILILDEPTASLAQHEAHQLLRLVRALAAQGSAVLFVSHRMAEVRSVADRFLVLRDGEVALDAAAASTSDAQLGVAMFGAHSDASPVQRPPATPDASILLRVTHAGRSGEFSDVDLTVQAGEVVVCAGLVGAGRSELAQAVVGLRTLERGTVEVDGRRVASGSPRAALAAGLAYVPEHRLLEGLFPQQSVESNLASAILPRLAARGWVRDTRAWAAAQVAAHQVRPPEIARPLWTLSGGNQQKVLLAKWLAAHPKVLVLDEPTTGVDVAARHEIHQRIRALAAQGLAVLVISSDIDEVLELATRILVFRQGRLVLNAPASVAEREPIIAAMTGLGTSAGTAAAASDLPVELASPAPRFPSSYEAGLACGVATLLVALAIWAPRFFHADNLAALLRGNAVLLMLALGMLMTILTAGIDVSVGSMLAVVSVVVARLANHGMAAPLTLLLTLALGLGLGLINAALIAELGIPPIVATLGTLGLYRGLLLQWTGGEWVTTLPAWLAAFGHPGPLGMDGAVVAALGVTLLLAVFLNRTRWGRDIFRYGGAPVAARRLGVSTRGVLYTVYGGMGLLTAVAGVFYAAQLGSVQGNAAVGYELTVISAVVLGGANLAGGRGTLRGTVLGVLLLGTIQSALILMHVPTFWQGVATGLLVLLGVAAAGLRRRAPRSAAALLPGAALRSGAAG